MPVDSLLTPTQRYTRCRRTNCSLLLPSSERCPFFHRIPLAFHAAFCPYAIAVSRYCRCGEAALLQPALRPLPSQAFARANAGFQQSCRQLPLCWPSVKRLSGKQSQQLGCTHAAAARRRLEQASRSGLLNRALHAASAVEPPPHARRLRAEASDTEYTHFILDFSHSLL